jgi:hypothetical protein
MKISATILSLASIVSAFNTGTPASPSPFETPASPTVDETETTVPFDSHVDNSEYYNILTIDGGGIRGLIPAMVLQRMEQFAYTYAASKKYLHNVPVYPGHPNVVAMKDLFNMTAGTSTGSILAAGLAYPDVKLYNTSEAIPEDKLTKRNGKVYTQPGFFADGLIDIYAKMGDKIFVPNTLGFGWDLLWFVVFVGVFGAAGWFLGIHWFENEDEIEALRDLRKVISNNKCVTKNKEPKHLAGNKDE